MTHRILPIGIQTFAKIRKGNFYYVDKTPLALMLAQEAGNFFLSRPRRFGKSLFLDTLRELFEGNQALFAGLFIDDKWDWTVRHPVLNISFGGGNVKNVHALGQMIHKQLERHERRFNLPARYPDARSRLTDLIERLHQETGQAVVVLVDEYDKPILDNLENSDVAQLMRDELKDLYSVIKDSDAHIRFVFLTGVSKFSKVSLFSGMNNLRDITLTPEYSAICGYTDADLDNTFAQELAGLDRNEIRRWYNGYNWRGQAVYNPFDLLLLFQEREFGAYWFESGTPGFLIKLLGERQAWLPSLGQMKADTELLSAFDVDNISTVALMFQSGYLTIDHVEWVQGSAYYQLCFPNHEVRVSFYGSLLRVWAANPEQELAHKMALPSLVNHADFAAMQSLFQSFFASIPHHWYTNSEIANYEGYYASLFYAWFVASGMDVRVEDVTNLGRIDMTVKLAQHIILFEFKVVELVLEGNALQQIKDKQYAAKYLAEGLPIYLVGVEFSRKTRNVVGFEFELID
jgi:Predicted AAA-ATPase/PD-(D/E)XK nuclease superfamily